MWNEGGSVGNDVLQLQLCSVNHLILTNVRTLSNITNALQFLTL